MLNAVDEGYGGLEHRASTALIASRRDLPARVAPRPPAVALARIDDGRATPAPRAGQPPEASDGYVTLLGLISHEYFHSWNVKRLKPREFARLDYGRENYTELLWFFEGFTSYYDDLLLLRAGLIDAARYLKLVAKTITGVWATPGRHVQSVAEASRDAWIKYYRPDENTPNATVSYYAKGSLVGLLADLRLRQLGGSLDGAMRRLWAASGAHEADAARAGPAGGIDEAMIAAALSAEAGRPMADELAAWVHGRGDLPLREALATHAVGWHESTPTMNQRMGWRVQDGASGVRITHVLDGGLAQAAGLAAGDELWAVGPWRLRRADDLLRLLPPTGDARLLLARDQRVLERRLAVEAVIKAGAPSAPMGTTVSLTPEPEAQAGAAALARRQAWLSAASKPAPHRPARRR
jgi:predicted metalloprotease with PDZ domain